MERICGKCGDPYLTLRRFGPPRCERCISRRRARPKLSPALVIAPPGERVCGYCQQVYAPSASDDSQPHLYCSARCGYLGRTDAASKAAQERFGEQEWWRRLMAINRHNSEQDNALIPFWGPERLDAGWDWHDWYAAVNDMRDEMGIPRVHGYPDPADLPPIIYPD
jgi:hypothetical protein